MQGDIADGMREPLKGPIFHLYIAGATRRSTEALVNLKRVLADLLEGGYELRVTDIYQEPRKAVASGVQMAPMLIREYPLPALRVVGGFSSKERIRSMLIMGKSIEFSQE